MSSPYKVLIITTLASQSDSSVASVVVDFEHEISAEIAIEKLEKSNEDEGHHTFVRAIRLYRTQSESRI
jgi:hypothetical protein